MYTKLTISLLLTAGALTAQQSKWLRIDDFGFWPYWGGEGPAFFDTSLGVTAYLHNESWNALPYLLTFDGKKIDRPRRISLPSARTGSAMAYDEARKSAIMFGGLSSRPRLGGALLDDTWVISGLFFAPRLALLRPSARHCHAMVYDAARKKTVLFGGLQGTVELGDHWEWDGLAWSRRSPSVLPPARYGHKMVYDSKRQQVVLFGGRSAAAAQGTLNDTWEWDGKKWARQQVKPSPPARTGFSMGYDPGRAMSILLGGHTAGSQQPINDTWGWDGSTWRQLPVVAHPPLGDTGSMVYDSKNKQLTLFSRTGVWALTDRDVTAKVRSLHTDNFCGAKLVATGRPVLGASLRLSASGFAGTPSTAALLLGADNTSYAGHSLPLSIRGLGYDLKCNRLGTRIDHWLPLSLMSGSASQSFVVPKLPSLSGVKVFAQALTSRQITNVLELTIGDK